MHMFRAQSIEQFLLALAARTPTPGGGGASALAAATGVAQAEMCASFTTEAEQYRAVEAEALKTKARFTELRTRLLQLMDKDAAAYQELLAARRLPKTNATEKQARAARVAAAQEEAVRVPSEILTACHEALTEAHALGAFCNPNLIADLAVAAWLLEAGARGAALQVLGNLKGRAETEERAARARETVRACQDLTRQIRARVLECMGLPDDT
jgi:formiminotetrahydrofolate cyclodeaminase